MSGAYAPDGSWNVTIVATESVPGRGLYAPDGSLRVTFVSLSGEGFLYVVSQSQYVLFNGSFVTD